MGKQTQAQAQAEETVKVTLTESKDRGKLFGRSKDSKENPLKKADYHATLDWSGISEERLREYAKRGAVIAWQNANRPDKAGDQFPKPDREADGVAYITIRVADLPTGDGPRTVSRNALVIAFLRQVGKSEPEIETIMKDPARRAKAEAAYDRAIAAAGKSEI